MHVARVGYIDMRAQANARRHARNLLVRALIREGVVKGTLER
jgi:hypothetical protein